MRTYISAVTINATGEEAGTRFATAARIIVDSDGHAEVEMRFTPRRHVNWPRLRQQATDDCIDAGLLRWATVGPQGGEDSVLVATDDLMAQLAPVFAVTVEAPGEEA